MDSCLDYVKTQTTTIGAQGEQVTLLKKELGETEKALSEQTSPHTVLYVALGFVAGLVVGAVTVGVSHVRANP